MTLRLTFAFQERLLAWALHHSGPHGDHWPDGSVALGVIDTVARRIRAVIVINARIGHMCSMHIATDGSRQWLSRPILTEVFDYAFRVLGHSRVNACPAADNRAAQILALKLGFHIEGAMKDGIAPGKDAILMRMLAQECPWSQTREGVPHGQELGTVT